MPAFPYTNWDALLAHVVSDDGKIDYEILQRARPQLDAFTANLAACSPASHPEAALSAVPQPCDLFLSTAVFTHFPGKNYGIRVTDIARRLLCPDGLALIQIRFSDGRSQENGTGSGSYQQAWNEYTSYTLEEYWNAAADLGLRPLYVKIHSEIGQATFALQRTC